MVRSFRKLTQADFHARIRRIQPMHERFGALPSERIPARPVPAVVIGFAWAYLLMVVAANRPQIQASLAQGSLAPDHQQAVLMILSALLAVSGVALALHLIRAFALRGGRRRNSRALLVGVVAAAALVKTPLVAWASGLVLMDVRTGALLRTASAGLDATGVPVLALADATFASSGNY